MGNLNILKEGSLGADDNVLVRLDLEIPVKNGVVLDDTRLKVELETLEILKKAQCKVAIIGHRGRQLGGKSNPDYSLEPVIERLGELINVHVKFVDDPDNLFSSKWTALENTRFFPGEQGTDDMKDDFARTLLKKANVFVFESFANSHREDATLTHCMQFAKEVYFGPRFALEYETISKFLDKKSLEKPVALILGGVKVRGKAAIIKSFIPIADYFVFGGALANTFLKAQGYEIGQSYHDENDFELAQELLLEIESAGKDIILPSDAVVCDEVKANAKTVTMPIEDIDYVESIGDIGKVTIMKYAKIIRDAKTVIFSGPMGAYELNSFEKGTKAIMQFLETEAKRGDKVLLGGGDTLKSLFTFGIPHESFDFVSMGGGAMLHLLGGEKLPVLREYERR